ncbi:hypothetical protein C8Q72DRAFT_952099 [Fomitopsis betulina]|nr:hypothetical protein C8Q72DRAFT_952099 [Fomitopsis betulina]
MGVPVKKPNTVVLAAGPLDENALCLLDTLRVRDEALYVTVSDSYNTVIREHTTEAEIVTLDAFLGRERQGYDLLFIPDCNDNELDLAARVRDVCQVVGSYVIAIGTGRLLLARSGLLKDTLASSVSLELVGNHIDDMAIWVSDEIVFNVKFWTAGGGPSVIRSLASLYKAQRKGDGIPNFPLRTFWAHMRRGRPSELAEDDPPAISNTPGSDFAKELAHYPPSYAESIAQSVLTLAIRLGIEGFADLCNSLLLTLLVSTYGSQLEHVQVCLGDPPSPEEVDSWGLDDRESHSFPAEEDREDILESISTRIASSDTHWTLPPYTLAGAIAMAIDAGKVDEACQWMRILVHRAMASGLSSIWLELARWRNVAELAITSGVVAEITGRTSQLAEQDTTALKEALLSFPLISAAVETQRCKVLEKFVHASMSSLVRMLDVLAWEDHETLLKPSASSAAIHDAEERLGTGTLPDDYKEFLLPVEALEWQDAEDFGLDDLCVDLGCKTDPAEDERLPKMGRVLVISDSNSEEIVWYVAPETVREAIRVFKAEGRSDETVGPPGLRVVFWVHYLPDLEWLRSFRGYVQYLARKAEKAGAKLE